MKIYGIGSRLALLLLIAALLRHASRSDRQTALATTGVDQEVVLQNSTQNFSSCSKQTIYLKNRSMSLDYVLSKEFMYNMHGLEGNIEQLHKMEFQSYVVDFNFTWYCAMMTVMLIGLTIISFLCFQEDFPPKKYQRDLDKHPFTKIELYYPPITLVVLTALIITVSAGILEKLAQFESEYQSIKCKANAVSNAFVAGYTPEEKQEYNVSWVGTNATKTLINQIQLQFEDRDVVSVFKNTFSDTTTWLEFMMYQPMNALRIAYAKNLDVVVKKPLCYCEHSHDNCQCTDSNYIGVDKKIDFLRQMGSMDRNKTHTNNIYLEYNELYIAYQRIIETIRTLSGDFGTRSSYYADQVVENKEEDIDIVENLFTTQVQRMELFFDLLDQNLEILRILLQTIYIAVFIMMGCAAITVSLIYLCGMKKLKLVLNLMQVLLELLLFVIIFTMLLLALISNASSQNCTQLETIFYNETAYNQSGLFFDKNLKDKLAFCFFHDSLKGDFNSPQNFRDLISSVVETKSNLTQMEEIFNKQLVWEELSNQPVMRIYDEVLNNPNTSFLFESYVFGQNTQYQLNFLNSFTDRDFKYVDKSTCTEDKDCYMQVKYGCNTFYDSYQFDKKWCPSGYSVTTVGNEQPSTSSTKQCILISNTTDNFIDRHALMGCQSTLLTDFINDLNPIQHISKIMLRLNQFAKNTVQQLNDLTTKLNNFQLFYKQLYDKMQELNKKVFGKKQVNETVVSTPTNPFLKTFEVPVFKDKTKPLFEKVMEPELGYLSSTDCHYLKYAMRAFEQQYCNEFMPKGVAMYAQVLLLFLLLCVYIVIIFLTSQRAKNTTLENIIKAQLLRNKKIQEFQFEEKPQLGSKKEKTEDINKSKKRNTIYKL